MAIEREWRLLAGEAHLAIRSDRRDHLPYGLYGGGPGTPSINILYPAEASSANGAGNPDQSEGTVLMTMISTSIKAGERIYHRQPGGGGFGDPLQRATAEVAMDVKNDKVSVQAAAALYGVVVDPESFVVDEAATQELRHTIRAQSTNRRHG
jgi:N-methylhydantoinase B